jgi:hypothetical protein
MAKLSKARRAAMPAKDFAGPGRSYPIPDKKHVAIAAGLAAMHGASSAVKSKIKTIATRKFGSHRSDSHILKRHRPSFQRKDANYG